MDVSKSICDGEPNVFEMKRKYTVSCVKVIVRSIVVQGTNILIFYIFEYGAEYAPERSAEFGAKENFIP